MFSSLFLSKFRKDLFEQTNDIIINDNRRRAR